MSSSKPVTASWKPRAASKSPPVPKSMSLSEPTDSRPGDVTVVAVLDRPSALCMFPSRGAKGAIHVNASGSGRALYQAVLDLDRLVDLGVCVLATAAHVAQTQSHDGNSNQVQPALGQATAGAAGTTVQVPNH